MNINDVISKSRQEADDFDRHRSPWESIAHWHVRKQFPIKNWDEYKDKTRLICLSQAWVNVHFSGNRYPLGVMEELQRMEEDLEDPSKMLRDAEIQVIGHVDHPPQLKTVHNISKLPHTVSPMQFVKQENKTNKQNNNNEQETQKKRSVSERDSKMRARDEIIPAKISKLEEQISTNINKESTKTNDQKKIAPKPITKESSSSVRWRKVVLTPQHKEMLKDLILRQRAAESAVSIISSSAAFSQLPIEYIFEEDSTKREFCCRVCVNEIVVGQAYSSDKKSAKHAAAVAALDLLRKTQPTIMLSDMPGNLDSALTRDDLIQRTKDEQEKRIDDNNVGSQLLRKMGWAGQDGLGKTGSGISVPVSLSETYGRAGLGLELHNSKLITYKDASEVLRKYASSESTEELTFSPELTNEERAKIHKLATRHGLKSRSYNRDSVRFLVVAKKKSAAALVEELTMHGGQMNGIELIKPGEMNNRT